MEQPLTLFLADALRVAIDNVRRSGDGGKSVTGRDVDEFQKRCLSYRAPTRSYDG